MKPVAEFYEGLHTQQKTYSAGKYHLPSLYAIPYLQEWLQTRPGNQIRILDVGCGKGLFLRDFTGALRSRWRIEPTRITGLDLVRSPDDLFHEISPGFEFIQHDTDGNPLPFANETFDFICCNHVLEHVFETEKLVREFRRVVARGGVCLISVPNLAAWINRVAFLWGNQPLGSEVGTESVVYGFRPRHFQTHLQQFRPSGHIRDFTPRALQDLCESCGFETKGWWKQSHGFIARLGKWAGREMGILLRPQPDGGAR